MIFVFLFKKSRFLCNYYTIIILIALSVIAQPLVNCQFCADGVETFEKTLFSEFDNSVSPVATLLQNDGLALTHDCINNCKQQPKCSSFSYNYAKFRCEAYADTSGQHR